MKQTYILGDLNNSDETVETLKRLFMDLNDVYFSISKEDDLSKLSERIDATDDARVIERIEFISKQNSLDILNEKIGDMHRAFKTRKGIKKATRDLGNYLVKV